MLRYAMLCCVVLYTTNATCVFSDGVQMLFSVQVQMQMQTQ